MEEKQMTVEEIACQQVLRADSTVYSIQWMTLPLRHAEAVTPQGLLERYLAHIRRFTLSLVRPVRSAEGIEFRLLATQLSLLSFGAPFAENNGLVGSTTLRICGGYLVQPRECDRGELSFITRPGSEGIRVTVRLADYCPLLLGSRRPSRGRKLLFRLTQALIHKYVTTRFLARLYRDLEKDGKPVRVVRVSGGGEDI